MASNSQSKSAASVLPETDKSFLVLFFKKELLSFLSYQMVALPRQSRVFFI